MLSDLQTDFTIALSFRAGKYWETEIRPSLTGGKTSNGFEDAYRWEV
jgi:hypothetical protein